MPPAGPPPQSNRAGKIALAVIGLLVGAGFPAATHRLTVPPTLLGGKYRLEEDLSQTKGKEVVEGGRDPKIRDPKAAVAQYTATSPTQPGLLVVSGMYGRFKDPAESRRKMMAGAADGSTVAVPARDIRPTGSDVTVSCMVLTARQDGADTTLPMCAWADENTGASIGVVTAELSRQDPRSVDLNKIAEMTLAIRGEARQPIG